MLELVLRVVLSLALVIGLLWLVARVSARRLRGSTHTLVRTVARQPLGRGSAVTVVSIGERVLVLGVTEHAVRLLTELEPDELATEPEVSTPPHPGELTSGVSGSVLSTQTWKQAFAAATRKGRDSS